MKTFLLAGLLLLPVPALADAVPSMLVETQQPHTGSLPDVVIAYGSAGPAGNGPLTLSLQQDGRIKALLVTPGEAVRTGQDLLDFAPSADAISPYQQAVTALSVAHAQRTHTARLLAQQLATRDQLARADKSVSDAESALNALREECAGVPAQHVQSPFNGVVAAIPVSQGDRVQPGAALITLTRADGLVVTVGIEPGARTQVHTGDPATLTPLSGGGTITGHAQRIDGVINPKTRQIDVDIAVPADSVISGAAFRADITTGQLTGWLVPNDAVLDDDDGAYLFQVEDGKAARVAVRILGTDGTQDVVQGPIDSKRPRATMGNYQLDNGTVVREQVRQAAAR
jgi:membrane fusion protein, multidrug efflux system